MMNDLWRCIIVVLDESTDPERLTEQLDLFISAILYFYVLSATLIFALLNFYLILLWIILFPDPSSLNSLDIELGHDQLCI